MIVYKGMIAHVNKGTMATLVATIGYSHYRTFPPSGGTFLFKRTVVDRKQTEYDITYNCLITGDAQRSVRMKDTWFYDN